MDPFERFIVRPRFVLTWLRITVPVQVVLVLLGGWAVLSRVTTGDTTPYGVDVTAYGTTSAFWAFAALPLAGLLCWKGQTELSRHGLRPWDSAWRAGRLYSWSEVDVVRLVWIPLFGRRWYIITESRTTFFLPYRPVNLEGFREAVELFAGPDHPLTRAVWSVVEEGQP